MNYPSIFLQQNYKLFILLFNNHLNTIYPFWLVTQSKITWLFLHKKWLKNHNFTKQLCFLNSNSYTWNSKLYYYTHMNHKLIKYMQITTTNYNINRQLTKVTPFLTTNIKKIQIYNLWFLIQSMLHTLQNKNNLFFLLNFTNINICLLHSLIQRNQKLTTSKCTLRLDTMFHNIKFL